MMSWILRTNHCVIDLCKFQSQTPNVVLRKVDSWIRTVHTTKPSFNLDRRKNWIFAGTAEAAVINCRLSDYRCCWRAKRWDGRRYVVLPKCDLVHKTLQWTTQQRTLLWVGVFSFLNASPPVNRITCWVNELHECPGKVKSNTSDWNSHKDNSVSLFVFLAFYSSGIRATEEAKKTNGLVGDKCSTRFRFIKTKKPIATQVRWESLRSVQPCGEQRCRCAIPTCATRPQPTHTACSIYLDTD